MLSINWHLLDEATIDKIPVALRAWLIDTGSLTAKLRRHCDAFSVHLLNQQQRFSTGSERKLLDLAPDSQLIEREVHLYCQGVPVIYANSLIPKAAIVDRFGDLNNLGEQPLGEKIFSDPQLERSPLEWGILSGKNSFYSQAVTSLEQAPSSIYGRRSLFYGGVKPILISEFFLPAISEL